MKRRESVAFDGRTERFFCQRAALPSDPGDRPAPRPRLNQQAYTTKVFRASKRQRETETRKGKGKRFARFACTRFSPLRKTDAANFGTFQPKNYDYFQIQKIGTIGINSLAFSIAFYKNLTACFGRTKSGAGCTSIRKPFRPVSVPKGFLF